MNIQQAALTLANTFAGTVAAVIAISAAIAKIKPIGNKLKRFFFAELYAANDKQDKRLDNLEMQQLKQIICDRRLPLGERVKAGDVYVERGGNGEIKAIHEALKKLLIEDQQRIEQEERRGL
jgi:ribosomal protein S13